MKLSYRLVLVIILFNSMPYLYAMSSSLELDTVEFDAAVVGLLNLKSSSSNQNTFAMNNSIDQKHQASMQSLLLGLTARIDNQDAMIVGLKNNALQDHGIIEKMQKELDEVKSIVHSQNEQLSDIKNSVDESKASQQNTLSKINNELNSLKKPSTPLNDTTNLALDIKKIEVELVRMRAFLHTQLVGLNMTKNLVNEYSANLDKLENKIDQNTSRHQLLFEQIISLRSSIIRELGVLAGMINHNIAFDKAIDNAFGNLKQTLLGTISELDKNVFFIRNELQYNIEQVKRSVHRTCSSHEYDSGSLSYSSSSSNSQSSYSQEPFLALQEIQLLDEDLGGNSLSFCFDNVFSLDTYCDLQTGLNDQIISDSSFSGSSSNASQCIQVEATTSTMAQLSGNKRLRDVSTDTTN